MPYMLLRVNGMVEKLTEKALRAYISEYGLNEVGYDMDTVLGHIASELGVARTTPIAKYLVSSKDGREVWRINSGTLVFTVVGRKVLNIRISLVTGKGGENEEEEAPAYAGATT